MLIRDLAKEAIIKEQKNESSKNICLKNVMIIYSSRIFKTYDEENKEKT